ncbi:hypothetical protein [Kordiimonas pumila]|uniref:Sporulation protein YjcZ n=1 Tax=Kordiimonas pumila TaxID=2161677 RepID=A0ABV7D447_9PROT|nr:hypothetical protein [Kordiimonas pumila]
MAKYDKVAGGSYGVYKKRPEPTNWGAIIFVVALILLIASCAT